MEIVTGMAIIDRILNSIQPTNTPMQINNSGGADKGVGMIPVIQNSRRSTSTNEAILGRKFEDLQLVDKTVGNCRLAMELDPTTFSSIISMVIVASREYDIVGTDDAEEKAIQHIERKAREWDLTNNMLASRYKGYVDGRCFIEKYIKPGTVTIESLTHQAYDSDKYDFLELRDPYTNLIMGYKQKARIYPLPANWETQTFDSLKNRQGVDKETTFLPDPLSRDETGTAQYHTVVMPRFLYGDGNSEGLVYKILDDAYMLKELKNILPTSVKMAAATLGVKVGDKDNPFAPYDGNDSYEEREAKVQAKLSQFEGDFSEKWKKEVVLYTGLIDPAPIGQGDLQNFIPQMEFLKQEIRAGLLTPDSKFESSKGSRFTAESQLSGTMGQVTVTNYTNNSYIRHYYEKQVFDHELYINKFYDSVGQVYIQWEEDDQEDEQLLSQVGEAVARIRPDLFSPQNDIGLKAYFPRIAPMITDKMGQVSLDDYQNQEDDKDIQGVIENSIQQGRGIPDVDNPLPFLNTVKTLLREEGVIS
jgi:hypothetical protein